ncbi:hypothetical protein [Mycolicibacterium hippocampi]|uniref:hypothetical protein n=1 Tax=Mycolicibacterium hippocampi TaxID=659824 RepID=UPI0021F2DC47|nr:hypothetical protein [Mycolicibacterium hippocampi]
MSDAASGMPAWVDQLAPLGITGLVSGLVVAIATHLLTVRRGRDEWLRELQIKANREFYGSAQDLMTYVVDGRLLQPIIPPGTQLGAVPDEIAKRRTGLNQKALELLTVGQERTVKVAGTATRILPRFAYLAVPLPGTEHSAALAQRNQAIAMMSQLLEQLGAVLRGDVGLLRRRQRRALDQTCDLFNSIKVECEVDDPRFKESPDLLKIFGDWQVRPLSGADPPADIEQYRLDTLQTYIDTPDDRHAIQAVAVKAGDEPWRLGIVRSLPVVVDFEILKDAIRLITGHIHGFDCKFSPKLIANPGVNAYAWIDIDESACQAEQPKVVAPHY